MVTKGADTSGATYLLTKAYWSYLTHYTKPTDDLSGLEVLLKIVSDKRIKSSSRKIVGQQKVVCFTECSPLDIHALLEGEKNPEPAEGFRCRRSRHGVAVTRKALCEAGALPVIHGNKGIRDCLPGNQLFRFQKFAGTGELSDWTFEREFRFRGDVVLTEFNPADVILIVEDRKEMFQVLAQKKLPPFPVMPFDYVFSTDAPYARRTARQKAVEGYFPDA